MAGQNSSNLAAKRSVDEFTDAILERGEFPGACAAESNSVIAFRSAMKSSDMALNAVVKVYTSGIRTLSNKLIRSLTASAVLPRPTSTSYFSSSALASAMRTST